jgi:hypothetical protein
MKLQIWWNIKNHLNKELYTYKDLVICIYGWLPYKDIFETR